ncbi:MAG: D,D-dipeptide ABC transporter permease, partial [bacterium]
MSLWIRYRSDPAAVVGLGIVAATVFVALFAPLLAPHSPFALQQGVLQPPSPRYWLGTDQVGRDVLSNLI